MTAGQRISWAIAIVLLDWVTFFVPLTALFMAYVLIARPPMFKAWVDNLYK